MGQWESTSSAPPPSPKPTTALPSPPQTPPSPARSQKESVQDCLPHPVQSSHGGGSETATPATEKHVRIQIAASPPLPVHDEGHNDKDEHDHDHDHTHHDHHSNNRPRSRKEYMDSLVPPTPEEMARIAQVQLQREHEDRRKSREREKEQRRSLDPSRSSLEVQDSTVSLGSHSNNTTNHKPRRSSIFGSRRSNRRKSQDVAAESENASRSRSRSRSQSLQNPHHHNSLLASAIASAKSAGSAPEEGDTLRFHRAATLIQRTYRGYRTRREMKGLGLSADTRWTHALREMRFREATKPRGKEEVPVPVGTEATQEGLGASHPEAARGSGAARYKWKKVAVIAGRAAADMDDDLTSSSSSGSDSDSNHATTTPEKKKEARQRREAARARRRKDARMMGLQYFLEMVDHKHRYGSNLRTYHAEWKKADTQEPFFYWLDYGQGKNIEIASCPRERLEREQVRYLSREERQYYLVQVDADGRLCWAKNGMRIDTTQGWKDSIQGIVPADDPTPAFRPTTTNTNHPKLFPSDDDDDGHSSTSSSSSSSNHDNRNHHTKKPLPPPSDSELEAARAAKYATPSFQDSPGLKKVTHLSASTIFNTLLRKSVRKNTWIFVADTSFRLYVGIKDSGAFQHSSFLQGSRISAAGLIKIKNGRLSSLSPLSGHYRPPASNFRAFVHSLKEEGVDMSHVSISKSYAVLVGLEVYMKTRQKGKEMLQKAAHKKDKVLRPDVALQREEAEKDKSQSAEKERRAMEEEERKRKEESWAAVRVKQKLGLGTSMSVAEPQPEPEREAGRPNGDDKAARKQGEGEGEDEHGGEGVKREVRDQVEEEMQVEKEELGEIQEVRAEEEEEAVAADEGATFASPRAASEPTPTTTKPSPRDEESAKEDRKQKADDDIPDGP